MLNNGWISLHRKIMDNPIYRNSTALHCWIHCLLKATHSKQEFYWDRNKVTLEPGQFITGRDIFGEEINLPPSTAWFWLQRLKLDSMIDIESSSKGSLVTVKNWDYYQSVDSKVDSGRTADGQRTDTYNNDNNVNNVNKRESKKKLLRNGEGYLTAIPQEDLTELKGKYNVTENQIKRKGEEMYNWLLAKGRERTYKDFKRLLMNALAKDFGYKRATVELKDTPLNKDNIKKLADIRDEIFGKN